MIGITANDDHQFYPTPPELAAKMFEGVNLDDVKTVLEPSAGKGSLIEALGEAAFALKDVEVYNGKLGRHIRDRYRNEHDIEVDAVEIDSFLRSILAGQFSAPREREERARCEAKAKKKHTGDYFNFSKEHYSPLLRTLKHVTLHIVHDDFLTFRPYKNYDLIVMNPPFKDGDKHLLHALEIQKNGGAVICLLNAETIRNVCTNTRRDLQKLLDKYGATIEFVEDAFKGAERAADVDVAIVKVIIREAERVSSIFERLEEAAREENFKPQSNELSPFDFIEAAVRRFNIECRAGLELIREWQALSPYILENLKGGDPYNNPIIKLKINDGNDPDVNRYLQLVRLKYWRGLFKNDSFMGRLTSKIRDEYYRSVENMRDFDFTEYNIKQVMAQMNGQLIKGVKDAIMTLFDKLTTEHSWYPETAQNVHYYNGWAANKAHKIGKKSILPFRITPSNDWSKDTIDEYTAFGVLSDLEKVFDYLAVNMLHEPAEYSIRAAIQSANRRGSGRNIELTYFTIDAFKKGTIHIKYKYPELVDRFNIYAALNRNWLPPYYGKMRYDEMDEEGRAVVSEFHYDEKDKTLNPAKIKERYAAVCASRQFYIESPVKDMLLLAGE